eukprot:m.243566 g.243566  ORF g.243566 m.243566 type:complete len:407 (-) comp28019_c0_seq1:47-1267(-)
MLAFSLVFAFQVLIFTSARPVLLEHPDFISLPLAQPSPAVQASGSLSHQEKGSLNALPLPGAADAIEAALVLDAASVNSLRGSPRSSQQQPQQVPEPQLSPNTGLDFSKRSAGSRQLLSASAGDRQESAFSVVPPTPIDTADTLSLDSAALDHAQPDRTIVIKILFTGVDADAARVSSLAARVACAALLEVPSSRVTLEIAGPSSHQFLLISVLVPQRDVGRITAVLHSPLVVSAIEHTLKKSLPNLSLSLAATSVFPAHLETTNNSPDEAHVGSTASAVAALAIGAAMLSVVGAAVVVGAHRLRQHARVRHSSEIDESEPLLIFDEEFDDDEYEVNALEEPSNYSLPRCNSESSGLSSKTNLSDASRAEPPVPCAHSIDVFGHFTPSPCQDFASLSLSPPIILTL